VLAALLHDPEILIMDEPFSGLDPVNVSFLKEAFLELHQQGKRCFSQERGLFRYSDRGCWNGV
jgi:ABC-type uncharacterized transport system ATPase subunit